jgi:hypothetical protein
VKPYRFSLACAAVLCIILSAFMGCTLFPKKRMDTESYEPFNHYSLDEFVFYIDDISLEYAEPAIRTEYPLREVLINLGRKHDLRIVLGSESGLSGENKKEYLLSFWLKEDNFVKDLTKLCSITALFTLHTKDSGDLILRGVYTEESVETVESFYHLYTIFDYGLEKITHELKKYREKKKKGK